MLARMRQTRMERVKAKMEEEGIDLKEPESSKPTPKKLGVREEKEKSYRREAEQKTDHSSSRSPVATANIRDKSEGRVKEDIYTSLPSRLGLGQRLAETAEEDARRPLNISPSSFITPPQVKFYDSAIDTEKRRLLVDTLVQRDIKNKANSKKINKKSEQILRDKVFSSLMEAIMSVCPTAQDTITFERLGRILSLMNVFTHIQYDEECEVIVDMELTEKADQLERYDEVKQMAN